MGGEIESHLGPKSVRLSRLACRRGAGATHEIDQVQRCGRLFIAPPCHVLVGTHERELAYVERSRIGRVDVENCERNLPSRGCFDDAGNADGWIDADERVVRP